MGDLFVQDIIDYSPKEERTMMERPFFSLSKRKRNKPIDYVSDDKQVFVRVLPHPDYGMATIWDHDILIWCISKVVAEKARGSNFDSRTIYTTPHEILRGIARGVSGTEYRRLFEAINRLRHTSVETNIRARGKQFASFSWLSEFQGEGNINTPDEIANVKSISLSLPMWIHDAILKTDNVLTLDREYFMLTSGLDRALYRIARKHAGAQTAGWTCGFPTLHMKTGSDSSVKKFNEMLKRAVKENNLPRYQMTLTELQDGTPAVHFIDRKIQEVQIEAKKLQADTERLERLGREDARQALIDSGKSPRTAKR
ncbi:replication initiator protein A [Asticcacaulis sp. YBE204]|uniref:replication initiator protein A n=1 Tax=Asticcacaulis sp. YBE204 TaxID=1282363 RepID=UPI0003C3D65B|nr:replication initiator protein A [Asticcacaulis sp. YBE204]ESQ79267.1 hypothetical protein AEYBE204_09670 [Asticcacaulis sp. YBE204]